MISYASVALPVPEDVQFCILPTGLNVTSVPDDMVFKANPQEDERNVKQEKYLKEPGSTIADLMQRLRGDDGKLTEW